MNTPDQGGTQLDAERFEKVKQIFFDAIDLAPADRVAYVAAAAGSDHEVRREVLGMLEEDANEKSILEADVGQLASEAMPVDSTSSPLIPLEGFGPYRLLKIIGEGGMGVVYLAEREDLHSFVAVKFLRGAWFSPVRRERFAFEQQTLAQLNHSSIARLYDAGALRDGTPWFVMEYVAGLPITEYSRKHVLDIEQRLRVFKAVCHAVQYAHEHAVIHRDLKPSNILVNERGEPKLLDFGIAKRLDYGSDPPDKTRTEERVLTPAFAAPEQIRGESIGVFTDVYALGVILYELLLDRPPFDFVGLTPGDAERRVLEAIPELPSAIVRRERAEAQKRPSLTRSAWADLDVICATTLQKDPHRRYRSVEALLRDIDHFLRGEPLEARKDSFAYRMRKYIRRNRRVVIASAAAAVVLVGLVTAYGVRLAAARKSVERSILRMRRVQAFTLDLFKGDETDGAPPESLSVRDLLDRGVKSAGLLNKEPAAQADLFQTLGDIYSDINNYPRAEKLFQASLERRRATKGEGLGVAETLTAIARLRVREGRFSEAQRIAREALANARAIQPTDDQVVAKALFADGKALSSAGQYEAASLEFREAMRLQSKPGGSNVDYSYSLSELADVEMHLGNYDASYSLILRALSLDRKTFGGSHPNVAADLADLGSIAIRQGQFADAERLDREALSITERWYGPDQEATAGMMVSLGEVLINEGKTDEARELYQKALPIRERIYGRIHWRTANTLSGLGRIALLTGNRSEAAKDFGEALAIYRAQYHDGHYFVAIALVNVASVHLANNQYEQAIPILEEALRIYARTLPENNKNAAIAHVKLGEALVHEKRFAEAEAQTRLGLTVLTDPKNGNGKPWSDTARKNLELIAAASHP